MNWILVWVILLVLFVVIEVLTMGLTTIWFAGGALVAAITAALRLPAYIQIATFIVVSFVLIIFTRPIAVRYFNKDRVKTNAESIVGKKAIVTGAIDNIKASGQVTVAGMEWSARSISDDITIEEGKVVTVVAISGVKLIVEERKEEL
ncbi:MAG: NfeD family protein [Lachnospiraceae bacterium]|nr:NfeD family protein [Lachnospiraceae bacterium]